MHPGSERGPIQQAYFTVSTFFNQLEHLLSTELLMPQGFIENTPPPPRLILPVSFLNGLHGNSHGFEVTADMRPMPWWRLTANYSYVQIQVTPNPGSRDVSQQRRYEGLTPHHQVQAQSSFDLSHAISVDWTWRYVSNLPAGPVPAYATSNARVAWRPRADVELALTGNNLHQAHHLEWPTGGGPNVLIERTIFAGLSFRR